MRNTLHTMLLSSLIPHTWVTACVNILKVCCSRSLAPFWPHPLPGMELEIPSGNLRVSATSRSAIKNNAYTSLRFNELVKKKFAGSGLPVIGSLGFNMSLALNGAHVGLTATSQGQMWLDCLHYCQPGGCPSSKHMPYENCHKLRTLTSCYSNSEVSREAGVRLLGL